MKMTLYLRQAISLKLSSMNSIKKPWQSCSNIIYYNICQIPNLVLVKLCFKVTEKQFCIPITFPQVNPVKVILMT